MPRKYSRQAKAARRAKKTTKNRRRARQRRGPAKPSFALFTGLEEAEKLLKNRKLDEAVEVLEELERRYRRRPEVLGLLLDAYLRQQDMWSYQAVCQRLLELDTEAMDLWLALAGAALNNGQMATAHQAFVYLMDRWPDNPEADRARVVRDDLAEFLRGELVKAGMPQGDGFDLLILHDRINLAAPSGRVRSGMRVGRTVAEPVSDICSGAE